MVEKNKHIFDYFIFITILVLFTLSFLTGSLSEIFEGYKTILTHPSNLLVDYFEIAGLSATLFNSAVLLMFNFVLLKLLKLRITGVLFSGFYIVLGFAFFGKNVLNVIPIYVGIYLYTVIKKIPFKKVVLIALFSSGVSPITSTIMFGIGLQPLHGVLAGTLVGILVGFVITPIVSHSITFHMGYSLYNVGFASGLIAIVVNGVLKAFGYNVMSYNIVSTEYSLFLTIFLIVMSISLMVIGIIFSKDLLQNIMKIYSRSGRAVTNFEARYGAAATAFNCGTLGLLGLIYVRIVNVPISGPVAGAIITMVGFGALGKHIKNCIPVMLGYLILSYLSVYDSSSTAIVIGGLFVTGVAPIAGKFGAIAGLVAGAVHLTIVTSTSSLYAGMDLYNNGFASAFTATIVVIVLSNIFIKEEE